MNLTKNLLLIDHIGFFNQRIKMFVYRVLELENNIYFRLRFDLINYKFI